MTTSLGERPSVAVVIPTRCQIAEVAGRPRRLVDDCLEGLMAESETVDLEVITVLDADVPGDTLDKWRQRLGSRLLTLSSPLPFNFSKKVNMGAAATQADFVLFLNDDIKPIQPGWLAAMTEIARVPDVGAVGARLLYEDHTIQHVGHAYAYGAAFHFDAGQRVDPNKHWHHGLRQVSGVTAACLMQRREIWQRSGGFDESLSNNFNDVEYCWRLRRQGYKVMQLNDAELFHYETKTRSTGAAMWEIERIEGALGDQLTGPDDFTPEAMLPRESRFPVSRQLSRALRRVFTS